MATQGSRSVLRAALAALLVVYPALVIYRLGDTLLYPLPAGKGSEDDVKRSMFKLAPVKDQAAALAAGALTKEQPRTSLCPSVARTNCEVIHLAAHCTKIRGAREAAFLMKSVLIHRSTSIHFHFLVDDIAHVILEQLLRTWDVSGVYYSFYKLADIQLPEELGGLEILQLHDILPSTIQKVIVLSPSIMLNSDPRELWCLFDSFDPFQHIGMPIVHGTVRLGVMLLDLAGFRRRLPLLQLTKSHIHLSEVSGRDKDALDSLFRRQPELFYRLPCQWNYEQSDTPSRCPAVTSDGTSSSSSGGGIKVLHYETDRVPRHDWQVYLWVTDYNGNQLRSALPGSRRDAPDPHTSILSQHLVELADRFANPVCSDYTREFVGVFRTHLYYMEFDYEPDSKNGDGVDVTLVTQVSISRLNALEKLCTVWPGPISVAIYLKDSEARHFESYVRGSDVFSRRKNIAFHLVYQDWSQYPTNHLRNVAAMFVKTSHVFLLDVDFLPVKGVYPLVIHALQSRSVYPAKTAFVVPAFETDSTSHEVKVPKSREKMLSLWDRGIFFQFRLKIYEEGHRATNYTAWRNATAPYQIHWEYGYEPYLVMASKDIPHYNERFMGYGGDKVSHVMEVAAMGYSFVVLPDVFIVHMPHGVSFDSILFRSSMPMKICLKVLLEDFGQELLTRYGNDSLFGWKPTSLKPALAAQSRRHN